MALTSNPDLPQQVAHEHLSDLTACEDARRYISREDHRTRAAMQTIQRQ